MSGDGIKSNMLFTNLSKSCLISKTRFTHESKNISLSTFSCSTFILYKFDVHVSLWYNVQVQCIHFMKFDINFFYCSSKYKVNVHVSLLFGVYFHCNIQYIMHKFRQV